MSPWLGVPLDDYESHMSAPQVAQLSVLSDIFAEVLEAMRPTSVAVVGVAGGNGLEHIDSTITQRVVGIDVQRDYLAEVLRRYGSLTGLELHCIDLAREELQLAPVDLVHAALVFEHAGVDLCLRNALSLVAKGGALSVVLQLPSDQTAAVASTGYASIQSLSPHFRFIEPDWLRSRLSEDGFDLLSESRRSLPGGKGLWAGVFRQPSTTRR